MFSKGKLSTQSPSKAVNYFRHFPTSFLKPYGLADAPLSDEALLRRMSPINCEWMRRPQTGVSEFAETIDQNLSFLSENSSDFLKKRKFTAMAQKLLSFTTLLKKFNTRNNDDQPAPGDIKDLLKVLLADNEEVDDFFQQMYQFGGAMYLLGVHYSSIKALLSNPEFYAQNSLDTFSKELKDFKTDATIKGMKNMLTAACCSSSQPSTSGASGRPRKRNLLQFLESDDDEEHQEQEQNPPAKPSKAKTAKQS